MKNFVLYCSLLGVATLVLFSCTMEKRVHRPGYHVEWKKSPSITQAKPETPKKQTENVVVPEENHTETASIFLEEESSAALGLVVDVGTIENRNLHQQTHSSLKSEAHAAVYSGTYIPATSQLRMGKKVMHVETTPEPANNIQDGGGSRLEVVGLLSMIFGIVAFLSFPYSWPVFGLAAFIMSIVSFSRFRRYPGEFSGRGFALAGFILSLVSLALFLGFWFIALLASL